MSVYTRIYLPHCPGLISGARECFYAFQHRLLNWRDHLVSQARLRHLRVATRKQVGRRSVLVLLRWKQEGDNADYNNTGD